MKIIVNENQNKLIRRLSQIGNELPSIVYNLNKSLKKNLSPPQIKNMKFGHYEVSITGQIDSYFKHMFKVEGYSDHEMRLFVSGMFNKEMKQGFKDLKKGPIMENNLRLLRVV